MRVDILDERAQYKKAGVDVQAGIELVDWLKDHVSQSTSMKSLQRHLISGIGGFASVFRIPDGYKRPCLVSCTDGVGSKLLLAIQSGKFQGLGKDLVAMCLNDLIVQGASPLFFLDYFSTGKLDLNLTKEFLLGVQLACKEGGCLLVGGETAEMPGFYPENHFDCAGFAVGIVEEDQIITGENVQEGDYVLGIESSGFHSNGYSLLRQIFKHDFQEYLNELLIPTRLYVEPVCNLLKQRVDIHAMTHITGGGMDNIGRVLKDGVSLTIENWVWPPIYKEIQKRTGMSATEALKTFNCGVGYVLIIPPTSMNAVQKEFDLHQCKIRHLGILKLSDSSPLHYKLDERIENK